MSTEAKTKDSGQLQGQVERLTFYSDDNAYAILKLKVLGVRELITVCGTMPGVLPGESIHVNGSWQTHPKYGRQFNAASFKSIMPATVDGIEKYLGSGMIKGIGPSYAKRLVEAFGKHTLDIIENDIESLRRIEGIGDKRLEQIKTAWDEQREIRSVMLFLQSYGVSTAYAAKIYKRYGNDSVQIVSENPYRLAMEIWGIGFVIADKIAAKLGVEKNSPIRAEAGVLFVLKELTDAGNVCFPFDSFIDECVKVLEIPKENVALAVSVQADTDSLVVEDSIEGKTGVNSSVVYLNKYYTAELGITKMIAKLKSAPVTLNDFDGVEAIDWVQKELHIKLAKAQQEAVKSSFAEKVLIITGGPGTGKTTIINSILRVYKRLGLKISLCAPTGRASKRMSEVTRSEAKTIHRMLDFSPKEGAFKRNEKNPLIADLLVVDEASMVDTMLMYQLLRALPVGITLILVGDVDQLPSVGAGTVLKDIIESKIVHTVMLNEIFRQSQTSLIVTNAHKINKGEGPILVRDLDKAGGFYFLEEKDPEKILAIILHLNKTILPERFDLDTHNDIQILTAMNKGLLGTTNLNAELQNALNPEAAELQRMGKTLRVGDKVMQIVNNYDKEVFNGDIGRINDINEELQELKINFYGRLVTYDYKELDEVYLAYAISIHKSQGSEYPAVIIPIHTQHYIMLQRNLIYTAVTRGKRVVVLVGTKQALYMAVNNDKERKRYSRLKQRLVQVSSLDIPEAMFSYKKQ
ncbi:MAG: ATP-dependent RecD-like DNA helicase [Nitrospirae bacterium]|nr:ATP-dependent RecD-like DNA helicase [Nitrospirota bacterium]MBF0535691.1 ATP-dependent RecD-like DNA helicase [Nitrospirota bacterium]MBF0617516.1 ATP-dependent RecD-like DNA helicase [Nitrospirota bacterium]